MTQIISVKRLVISNRNGKVYHMWRKCKMIDKHSTFFVEEINDKKKAFTPTPIECYMIHKKKKVTDYEDVFDVISQEIIRYSRNLKLNRVLD